MSDNTRKVIGIDPASGKGSYVFAPDVPDPNSDEAKGPGIDRTMTPLELRELLPSPIAPDQYDRRPFDTESCLVCWDAPLMGLQNPDELVVEETDNKDDKDSLTTRPWAAARRSFRCDVRQAAPLPGLQQRTTRQA